MGAKQTHDQMEQQPTASTAASGDAPEIASMPVSLPGGLSRRRFLGRASGVVAATMTAGALAWSPLGGVSPATVSADDIGPVNDHGRANEAFEMRVHVAQVEHSVPLADHPTNGDEALYANKIGNYCKGLPGSSLGEVNPAAYTALIQALSSGQPADFENIPLGGSVKLANPQAAYAFMLEGPDSHAMGMIAPPAFSSAWEAAEMAEDYWMALTRDVPVAHYGTDPLMAQAAHDLSGFSDFRGPKAGGVVSRDTLFRGPTPGDTVGPYLSQFLWATIPYGPMTIVQQYPTAARTDYMTAYSDWLRIQQGAKPAPGAPSGPPRYISTGRDLAAYVHGDFTYQAYLNACLILLGLHAPLDIGNPYLPSKTQSGFGTFGGPHILDLAGRVASAALKACWYQKWLVHRRVRPEAFGGNIHNQKIGAASYPIHPDLLTQSSVLGLVVQKYGAYLLPQAYPEGCPTHPSYPAGHAAIAGACVTVLKAFFNESFVLPNPVVASADGSMLNQYTGPAPLTVGGELNKLASNISLGRNFAGIHWRSDGIEGLKLGEAVAIGILTDQRATFTENFSGFSLTKFDGTTITV